MAKDKPVNSDKVSPFQYLAQVRQEGRKVIWPNRQETTTTTILVMIMVILSGIFFFFSDWILRNGVEWSIYLIGLLFGGSS